MLTRNENRELQKQIRMEKVAKAKFHIFIICAICLISIMLISFSLLTFAKEDKTSNMPLSYKSIEITSGDTLWDIAEEYNYDPLQSTKEMMNEIISLNQLKNETIIEGQYILIPIV